MRLGKFVEHFKAAAIAADAKGMDPVLKFLAVGRQLGYGFYMSFDALTYFDSVGVRKFEGAARLQKEAYRAWLAGLLCNVAAGLYTLYGLQVAAKKSRDSQDAEKAVELKKLEKYVFCALWKCEVVLLKLSQGEECGSAAAHLRPLRLHCAEQWTWLGQLRRRFCWSCRNGQQLYRMVCGMGQDGLSAAIVNMFGREVPVLIPYLHFIILTSGSNTLHDSCFVEVAGHLHLPVVRAFSSLCCELTDTESSPKVV